MSDRTTLPLDDDLLEDVDRATDFSGEDSASGSASDPASDDDVGLLVADITGEEPVPGEPFSIAGVMEFEELARRGIEVSNFEDE